MEAGKILIIDDSEIVLNRVKLALTSAGYDAITTTQVVGNARHLKSCDLVIMDFHMPGLDGGEVLRSLKSAVSGEASCLFYLYTSDEKVADTFASLGFDGAFTHKGDEQSLLPQVRAVFRMRKMRALSVAKPRRSPP